MRRVFKTRTFARWATKPDLADAALCNAVSEMARGPIDAGLGGQVVKKRVALPGHGKRGSVRTIVATRKKDRWFFIYGFAKNERANIDQRELKVLQEIAKDLLALDERQLESALKTQEIVEICHEQDEA